MTDAHEPAPVLDATAEPVLPVEAAPVVVAIDRRTGSVMRALAIGGVVVSLVLMVVAWDFLGDLERNVDQSLRIGEDAAVTLGETIDLAAAVIAAVDSGIVTLGQVLDTVELGLADTSDVAASTSDLSVAIADSIDDVDVALRQVESLAATIDTALRAVSRIPLGPDYDPEVSYPEAIAGLRAALEPIDAEMRSLAVELDDFAASSGSVGPTLDELQGDLVDARAALAESDALIDRYRAAADEAGALAARSRDDLESSMWWARFTAVLLGFWIIAAQYVPWWLGSRSRPAAVIPLGDSGGGDPPHRPSTVGDGAIEPRRGRGAWAEALSGIGSDMTDYTERGAVPVEDAAVDDPPTVDEVLERQREEFPEQAATSTMQPNVHRAPEAGGTSAEKPVDQWVTGDEPMTGPQRSYLETLAREAGTDVPDDLTKAQASEMIEQLQRTTGRGDAGSSGGGHGDADQRSLIAEVAEDGIVDRR